MADDKAKPLAESIWPPAPQHDAVSPPLFVSAEGVEVTQSGGRLSVVNHFMRRMFALQMCILSLSSLSPFYSYWTSPFHHATWRAMLPAVFATYKQMYWLSLLMLCMAALFYWLFTGGSNLSGIVLNQRDSTAKAGGRTRPLSELDSVEMISRQPDIFRRRHTVRLQWSDEGPVLPWWQRALFSMGLKTSFVGVFRQEANAEKLVKAIAEFAGLSAEHRTFEGSSV